MLNLARVRSVAWLVLVLASGCASDAPCPCHCPADQLIPWSPAGVGGTLVLAPNARIPLQLARFPQSSVTLVDSDTGLPVPFDLVSAGDVSGSVLWVVPRAALPPGTFAVSATHRDGRTVSLTFGVAGDPDTTPPALLDLSVLTFTTDGSRECEVLTGGIAGFRTAFVADGGVVTQESTLLELELVRDGVSLGSVFPVGNGAGGTFGTADMPDCLGAGHLPGLDPNADLSVRARAWDLAGNVADAGIFTITAGRARRDTYPCERWCSASPGRGGPVPSLAIGLALALGWLGRYRARRARRSER